MANTRGAMGGALLGLTVGAIAGILLAPKSGKELRQDIKNKAWEARDKAKQKVDRTKQAITDKAQSFRKEVNERAEAMEDKARGRGRRPKLFSASEEI